MRALQNIKIGADIEVFVKDARTNEIVSAEGLIRGTKTVPFVFDKSNKYFATSLDNVLAEFCIPPVKNREDFYKHIRKSIGYIESILPDGLCVAIQPSANLDKRFLQTENAQTFGCEVDFSAYTLYPNMVNIFEDETLRCGGGHIHVGYNNPQQYDKLIYKPDEERVNIVKALDLFVGIPSVIMEPENKRKILYGKAGAFRPKPYGVEYRTISNYYLRDEVTTKCIYDNVREGINFLNRGNEIQNDLAEYVHVAIDSCNKEMATNLINDFKLNVIHDECKI